MINIAIDGPSGAGKSTIAKEIAKRMDIIYLDTGAMYRAIGLKAFKLNINSEDVLGILSFLDNTKLEIKYKSGIQKVILDGKDVSEQIREHNISKLASNVSKIPQVREKLVKIQREIALLNDVVLDGRDITSYVLPNANYKFFVTASPEVRAKRRFDELVEKGQNVDYIKILEDVKDRDYNDSTRAFAPLTQTDDSILVDTTNMNIVEVVAKIMSFIK